VTNYCQTSQTQQTTGSRTHPAAVRSRYTFVELSPLAARDMYDNDAPSAGIVTGIGLVEGQECVIVANDATVKAVLLSDNGERSTCVPRRLREQNHLPCIYLVDSGGHFCHCRLSFSRSRSLRSIFYNQAHMSSMRNSTNCRRHGIMYSWWSVCASDER